MAFREAKCLSSTSCLNVLLATSARDYYLLITPASAVVTDVFTFVSAGQFFIAYVLALWSESATNNGRFEESAAARAGLRLAVYNWTLFTKTHVARLSTFMFSTVQQFGAIKLARMVSQNW